MSLFNTFNLKVNRYSGSYIDGKWTNSLIDEFFINTSWQAITGEDLKILPEGKRGEFTYTGYTDIELKISDPKKQNGADVVIGPDGYQYEVVYVKSWQNKIIPHYKFIVTRIKEGT